MSVPLKFFLRGCRLTVKVQELGKGVLADGPLVMVSVEMSEMLEMLEERGRRNADDCYFKVCCCFVDLFLIRQGRVRDADRSRFYPGK
jgi:hypothetical protein